MEDEFNPLDWIEEENRQENGDGRTETGKSCESAAVAATLYRGHTGEAVPDVGTEAGKATIQRGHDPLASSSPSTDLASEVDTVIARIESAFTDITTSYSDWISVGFAFAHEFGEAGRGFFQRVSRFYPGFTLSECNKQYDQCLKSKGHGITIKTFFHMAKQAGIEVRMQGDERGRDGVMERGGEGTTGRWSDRVMEREGEMEQSTEPALSLTPSPPHSLTPLPLTPSLPHLQRTIPSPSPINPPCRTLSLTKYLTFLKGWSAGPTQRKKGIFFFWVPSWHWAPALPLSREATTATRFTPACFSILLPGLPRVKEGW